MTSPAITVNLYPIPAIYERYEVAASVELSPEDRRLMLYRNLTGIAGLGLEVIGAATSIIEHHDGVGPINAIGLIALTLSAGAQIVKFGCDHAPARVRPQKTTVEVSELASSTWQPKNVSAA